MGLMTGMQKTLKKEAKPQFEETQAGKKMKDPELEALLAEEVITSDGKKIKVLTGFFDERSNEHIFKCFICDKQINGKKYLMTHLSGDRHKRTKQQNFNDPDAAKSRRVPMERPICRFFAETGICKRFKSACPNRHER